MSSPPGHSYPSPTQAQISDGAHPFYAPHQQQPAPQAIMDPQHQPREQSMPSSQGQETYPSRAVAPHPQPYSENQGHPEYAMQQMQQQPPQQHPHLDGSGTPVSKRPKTTRACDQCRGKKTRCDPLDADGSQCTSCRKNNQMCEFSREPQKRGPSKGYIKELAERVGALESDRVQIAPSPSAHFPALSPVSQSHGLPISYSGTPPRYGSNKRTHSMSEDLQNSPALQAQLQASVNLPTKPGPGPAVQRSIATEGDRASYPVEEMETALNVYYTKTHPFLPFLPHSKDRLLSTLAKVSSPVHEAFNAALILYAFPARFGTLPSSRGESLKDPASNLTQAVKDLLHDHHATQTQTEKLVALQSVLLMIFADEVNHPREIGNRGWYGQAFVASTFMFQTLRSVRKHGVGPMDDLDAHQLLLRRAFLSLVAMERWNAAGVSAQTIIPDDLTYLVAADKVLLGDLGYSALNASFVLSHVTDIVLDPTNSPDVKLWRATSAEKDRVVQSLELEKAANNVFLPSLVDLYFHQQVPSRLTDLSPPTRTLNKAITMLSLLAKSGTSFPLNHHLTALPLMVLDEAIRKRGIGIEARQTLTDVFEGLDRGVISAGETWTRTLLSFVEESLSRLPDGGTTDRAGLQNLADAAVGETEDGVAGSHNLAPEDQVIVRTGYLTYVIQ